MSSQTGYKQVFQIHIESEKSVDYDGKGDTAHAIVPNSPYPYFTATNETRKTIGDKIQAESFAAFGDKARSEATKNGIAVSLVEANSLQYHWIETNKYTSYIFPATPITIYSEKYTLDMDITVWSDLPFAPSPMPLWVMQIIKWALEAVVMVLIAYWAIQAIQACVQSLFVKKQTVTVYNPDGTIKEETTTEEPTFNATIFIVGALIVAAIVLFMYLGRGSKKS